MRCLGQTFLLGALGLVGLGASSYVPWEDLTEADWLYTLATRFATVDGHRVHYPTPTAELAQALEGRAESAALRHLAEARLEQGDRAGAVVAIERWALAEGAPAWAETARWGAAHGDMALAFRTAANALPGLRGDEQRTLADEQVDWADAHPEAADRLALRKTRATLFPGDGAMVEDWIRALEGAGRLADADAAVEALSGLGAERRLLLRSDLLADHGDKKRAFEVLDQALLASDAWVPDLRQAFAERTDGWSPGAPETWRATLDKAFDSPALLRLASYFQGQGRGASAADLLTQVERRYETGLGRPELLLLARLRGEIDAVPEAFRHRLSAAERGTPAQQNDDLAELVRLALRAGGRPLGFGVYNDEPYRWIARIDRTPGFWTGGLSFLLTGQDWKEALARLEAESLPERTFATARALLAELLRRAPNHPDIDALRTLVMARHVERGEGREALALLPGLEAGAPDVANEARRIALLAARQVEVPLSEELRLSRARLASLAATGSLPRLATEAWSPRRTSPSQGRAWRRPRAPTTVESYKEVLEGTIARLEQRDPSHRAAIDLMLGELDRLPDAEDLWSDLASRLESWNLDDDLGPRYERALDRFRGEDWWARAARWYARRSRQRDLDRLATELAHRFRGAAVFARADGAPAVRFPAPGQPPAGGRVRLVLWADWVRLRALERFPHSPQVFREARGRLIARGTWEKLPPGSRDPGDVHSVVVEDALLDERRWALLFADPDGREEFFAEAMRKGDLEKRLLAMASAPARTPVDELLLFEGWSRLSRFEKASAPADRLSAAYPGDGRLARRVLSLHRSLAALEPGHAAPAAALVARTAPALEDPNPFFTELGEMEVEAGHPDRARPVWDRILEREPRSPERILELATLLWDYDQMKEALSVLEEGRRRLARPHLFAFEAGVLREEQRDIPGAVREYLSASLPDDDLACFCSWFERDQRSLRRLAQLLGRERVLRLIRREVERLEPGVKADEHTLAALLPLAQIRPPDPDLDWTVDDWIDGMDLPRDPVGRAARTEARADWRERFQEAMVRTGEILLQKMLEMMPRATEAAFLDTADQWSGPLLDRRWAQDREVGFRSALLRRRAELGPSEEERVAREVERARYLLENGRDAEADAAWTALSPRIGALPEGAPRMHAEADRAAYLERAKGKEAATAEWASLSARYAWSLGVLEDRVAFLARVDRGAEGRGLLEVASSRAAAGHKEALLERLTRDSLAAGDLAQARRSVTRLLGEDGLAEEQRLGGLHLLARLSLREDPHFDLLALARSEEPKIEPPRRADLFRTLAEAAEAEHADKAGVTLWIEALNRRLERPWLHAASRAAMRAGQADALRRFFEDQQSRSPRDVRWAVAVREIRLDLGDLEGAIAMAKAAIAVRPDLPGLWREAADLLVRAGRPREAADSLEGWQRPRPGDEETAHSRSALYAQAGDAARALTVEQEALAASTRLLASDEDAPRQIEDRRGRAARHLLALGLPKQAWRLAVGSGGVASLAQSGLGSTGEAELALASGNFVAALRGRLDAEGFKDAAARVLAERGRPEAKDEVLAWMSSQVLPAGPPPARPQLAALRRVWPFASAAGMEPALRSAVARRLIAVSPGPWQAEPSPTLAEAVAEVVLGMNTDGLVELREPPLEALYVRDLVRRGNDEALWAFLEPRWREVAARVRSGLPVSKGAPVEPWALWLNDAEALEAFARATASRPERVALFADLLADRRLWDRLWAIAARDWNVGPLVAVLPEGARTAWFRHWQSPSALDPDPVLKARGESVERVSVALAHLIEGRPEATQDPLIVRLLGPRSVGDVLGSDPRWLWPELTSPAPARGADADDARLIGQGADQGRFPGALWGERPGAAWFVLETLARRREGDPKAALVPAEQPERAGESDRGLLAVRLAASSGDPAMALALDQDLPGRGDSARFSDRIHLLADLGRTDEARAAFEGEVRRQQAGMNEARFRGLWLLAGDLGLPDPIGLMDPGTEIAPVLLAFLYDWRGPAAASRFRPRDPADFRTALATRWRGRDTSLSADAVRFSLAELWKNDAAKVPTAGLRQLGPPWPESAAWLSRLRVHDREEGLAAIGAWPDATRLLALLARDPEPKSDVVRLLRLRVALRHGDDAQAVGLLDEALREMGETSGLSLAPAVLGPEPVPSDEDSLEEMGVEEKTPADEDATTARLRAWLEPVREAKRLDLALVRFEAALEGRRQRGPVAAGEWGLSLDLSAPGPPPAALLDALERAWIRGDLAPVSLGPVVQALARRAPTEAPRWLERWSNGTSLEEVAQRVRVLVAQGDKAGAARRLIEARAHGTWELADEVRAFDLWRRHAPLATDAGAAGAPPPTAWSLAREFWTRKAAEVDTLLAAHLRAHPFDVLAARAALRTVSPADEGAMRLAAAVLRDAPSGVLEDPTADVELLNLRAARGLLRTWPRAANLVLGPRDGPATAGELTRRRLPKADVDSALADVARIAAKAMPPRGADSPLLALDLRNPDLARAVRVEIREGAMPAPPLGYGLVSGTPVPYRPRDLGWPLLHAVVAAEGRR